jgi:hypothetical protein
MTPDIVAELHPPRLPAAFSALGWADLLAAFGVGLVLAALVLMLAGPLLRRRDRPVPLARRIKEAARLPAPERLLALARLLGEAGGSLPEDQRAALYSGAVGDPARIEALILDRGRRR